MRKLLPRRPSASLVIAVIALIVAASGTALAASKLVSGDKLIAKHSLSGNRLRNHTIGGQQVNLSKLATVPSAKKADSAASATTAATATNANALGGQPASSYLTTANRVGTNGIIKVPGSTTGHTVTLFTVGPFTVTLTCTTTDLGTTLIEDGASTEAGSWIDGSFVATASRAAELSMGNITTPITEPSLTYNENINFEAPSGANAVMIGATGVNSLGADCWANWVGIH